MDRLLSSNLSNLFSVCGNIDIVIVMDKFKEPFTLDYTIKY